MVGPGEPGAAEVRCWSPQQPDVKFSFTSCNVSAMTNQSARDAASRVLTTAPYVPVEWGDGAGDCAMVDTGADWSLVAEEKLSARERLAVRPSRVRGRGVSSEDIPVLGEVWRTVKLGGLIVRDQRFVVVRGLVVPAILGIDFWSRLGSMRLDLRARRLLLEEKGVELELLSSSRPQGTRPAHQVDLKLRRDVTVPPASEALVPVKRGELRPGEEYLLEPVGGDDSPVCASSCVLRPNADDTLWVKVANVSSTEEVLRRNEVVATASTDFVLESVRNREAKGARNELGVDIGTDLSDAQREDMDELIAEFRDVFYTGGELPVVRVDVEHRINITPGTRPMAFRPRRLSPRLEGEVRKELQQLEAMGVIRQSHSPWAAPVVCARRKDGRLRLAIDYRRVNAVSAASTLHPIPLMEDLLDRLGNAKFFTILDAKCGYHQLPLNQSESEVTAFIVPWGQYEWAERTPFGLHGAGFSFQRMMYAVLGESNFTEALCYLDDVLVWGETWEQHQRRLRSVLEKIRAAGLALSPQKCQFGKKTVEYLGAVISNGRISISEARVQQLRDLPAPRDVHELRRALGSFAYVQRWIPGVAETARPLYDALDRNGRQKLYWTDEMTKAFSKLKQQVSDAVALYIPDFSKPFVLVTDASDVGTGAMLANRDGAHLKPIGFCHHALSQPEKNYSTTEKELLAVVHGVKRFRVYLSNAPFELITDHRALRWLNSLDPFDERGRRGRWIDFLQQFQIRPVHRAGKHPDMTIADYLSRVGATAGLVASIQSESSGLEPDLASTVFVPGQVRAEQQLDPETAPVRAALLSDEKLPSKYAASAGILYRFRRHLTINFDGTLCYMFNGGKKLLPVIPRSLRAEALRLVHDAPLSGHMGRDRTWLRARDNFWWPNMKQDLYMYVSSCGMCGVNKLPKRPGRAPLQHTDIPDRPLARLQVDFVGPFPRTDAHPFRYVLQVQDVFSRYLLLLPAEDNTADTAARLVHDRWICVFDVPLVITSDRGPHFAAETFRAMCRRIGVRHVMGAPQHAQSQGQVERQNQLIANLRCVCCNDVRVWPKRLFQLQFSHNTSVNSATGLSPFELLFARAARRPESAVGEAAVDGPPPLPATSSVSGEVIERRRLLDELHREAQVSVRRAQNARVQQSVAKARGQPLEVGDAVRLRLTPAERSRNGGKMSPVLSPIYKVVEVLRGGWTYRVSRLRGAGRGADVKVRHYNDLVRPTARPDEAPRLESDAESSPSADGDSESAPDGGDGDVDESASDGGDSDVDGGQPGDQRRQTTALEREALVGPGSRGHRDTARSGSRLGRRCGPPARLVIDPSRKRYEDT